MGQLKPGHQYIYESPDNGATIYAREFGSDEKFIVGIRHSEGQADLENHILWNEVRQEAKTNPALQRVMENAIILYRLSKDNPK
ncbi:hypothetical protein EB118_00315 [bacterium]|nr:hypothetical protein [bacterium]